MKMHSQCSEGARRNRRSSRSYDLGMKRAAVFGNTSSPSGHYGYQAEALSSDLVIYATNACVSNWNIWTIFQTDPGALTRRTRVVFATPLGSDPPTARVRARTKPTQNMPVTGLKLVTENADAPGWLVKGAAGVVAHVKTQVGYTGLKHSPRLRSAQVLVNQF